MKLLYLYIGHMGRSLDYHEIPFSDDYKVHFDRDNRKLLIQKNSKPQESIYGDNIPELKLIVGKNGCGKTTILNLLGLTAPDLRREFNQYEDENEPWQATAHDWFALYHLEDDLFALEGYNPQLLLKTSSHLNTHYSAAVQYDFQTNTLEFLDFLQNFHKKEAEYKYINQVAYLSYSLEPDCLWYFRPKRQKYEKYVTAFLERYDISQFNFYGVEYFLYLAAKNAKDFHPLFDNTPAALKAEICLEHNEIDKRYILQEKDPLAEAIYGEGETFLSVSMPQLEKAFGSHKLLEDRNKLTEKYDWINEYLKLCDFTAYYSTLQELTRKKKIYASLRIEYLDQYRGYYLETLISKLAIDEAVLTHSWTNFNKLHRAAQRCCQDLNLIISEVLDYSFMPQQIRHQLYQKMDVQVCPYCNRQYIHTVSATENETYLGDLDHFYPKNIYQLFSLSLWNLTPVCKPCNQLFKRQYNRNILSPIDAGFGDDCILKIHYQDVSAMIGINDHFTFNWEIQKYVPDNKKEQIQQNLDMFSLNEVYQFHKLNIQDILRKHHLRSKLLADRQDSLLGDFRLSAEDVNRLFYGTSLNKDKFHKELLGKMVYDVVVNG